MRRARRGALGILLICAFSFGCKPKKSEQAEAIPAVAAYTFGTVVSFGQGGAGQSYKTSGWSKTEEKFTWTEGKAATIALRVPKAKAPLELRIKTGALVKPPELPAQPVEVYVNERKIADWQVSEPADFRATIPADIAQAGGDLTIILRTPKAISPKELDAGNDPRTLGLSVFEFELSKTG